MRWWHRITVYPEVVVHEEQLTRARSIQWGNQPIQASTSGRLRRTDQPTQANASVREGGGGDPTCKD